MLTGYGHRFGCELGCSCGAVNSENCLVKDKLYTESCELAYSFFGCIVCTLDFKCETLTYRQMRIAVDRWMN